MLSAFFKPLRYRFFGGLDILRDGEVDMEMKCDEKKMKSRKRKVGKSGRSC